MPAMWFYVSTYAVQLVGAFTVVCRGLWSQERRVPARRLRRPVGRVARSWQVACAVHARDGRHPVHGRLCRQGLRLRWPSTPGYLWLAIIGLVAAVAGLFFYLRVVVRHVLPGTPLPRPRARRTDPGALRYRPARCSAITVAITLVLGLVPWPLLNWVRNALPL